MKGGANLIGQKFGMLTVLEELQERKHGGRVYKCKCDCGNISIVNKYNLTSGHTKSCGCLRKENTSKMFKTHGKRNTRLFNIWTDLKQRCYNKHNTRYKDWGGRGIAVCDEWRNEFMSFHDWALNNGYNDKLSIDRIDNNGNYEPTNCRWVTAKQQARNRRTNINYTINGETRCIVEWCEILGLKPKTVYQRLHYYNWTIERALELE